MSSINRKWYITFRPCFSHSRNPPHKRTKSTLNNVANGAASLLSTQKEKVPIAHPCSPNKHRPQSPYATLKKDLTTTALTHNLKRTQNPRRREIYHTSTRFSRLLKPQTPQRTPIATARSQCASFDDAAEHLWRSAWAQPWKPKQGKYFNVFDWKHEKKLGNDEFFLISYKSV